MEPRFRFDRRFDFDLPPSTLWTVVTDVERYRDRWPWLVRFDLASLAPGATAACTVQAPLPYRLHFDVAITQVVPGRSIQGQVTGDITGPAAFTLESSPTGSAATLVWDLVVHRRLLRTLAVAARPALEWGHNRIVEVGLRQFLSHVDVPAPGDRG